MSSAPPSVEFRKNFSVRKIQSVIFLRRSFFGLQCFSLDIVLYTHEGLSLPGEYPIAGDAQRKVIQHDCLMTRRDA